MCFNKFNMTALSFSFISFVKIQNWEAQFLCLYSLTVGLTSNLTALRDKKNKNIKSSYPRFRNKRPGTFINFQENFHPRHAYSSHPVYSFLKLFPPTPFISDAFFLFRNIKSWRNEKLLFNHSYNNLLFRVLINLPFFNYPNHQARNFTTSFFKTCTCTRCSFVDTVNGFSHMISFKK